jgi:hypothetical protein
MSTRHLSIRLDEDLFDLLQARSRQTGQTISHLTKTLLEEGLRMERHPGIIFRPGPIGRRPGLVGGPDVWEVMRVLRGMDARGEDAVQQTASSTGLTPEQVHAAAGYYADYPDEIDDWIRRVEEEAAEAEAAWQRRQDLLGV